MTVRHLFAALAIICAAAVLIGVDLDAFKVLAVAVIFAGLAAIT